MTRYSRALAIFLAAGVLASGHAEAQPAFVNGLVIDGATLDATQQPGANRGRFGFFSDLYYDPVREEWWALSDRIKPDRHGHGQDDADDDRDEP